ncbi:DUF2975 domain-containing protein [Glutamicibacter ardleyensis]|uniref:DUF2975 domain-containing protein n=1 Tax=Glutamicibacter ardleyensis TaxID=225894 RepID=UPI003FD41B89
MGTSNTLALRIVLRLIIVAISKGSLMTFILGTVMVPDDAVAPTVVLLVGGFGVLLAGIALIVWVLRQLFFQASTTEAQAAALRTELGVVI